MLHKGIRDAEGQHRRGQPFAGQERTDHAAKAARQHMRLHRDDWAIRQLTQHFLVHRLHTPAVHQRCVNAALFQQVANFNRFRHHRADSQQRHILPLLHQLPFTDAERLVLRRVARRQIDRFTPIADGAGGFVLLRPAHHDTQLIQVARRQNHHVRHGQH